MKGRHHFFLWGTLVLGVLLLLAGPAVTQQATREEASTESTEATDGVDVQARGPVHEAFAKPAETTPQASPIIPKKPPDPVEEQPPDQKPEGDNVQWITGYWAWDEGSKDFLWVSGFWRDIPPGRQWVPGNWQEVEGGYQWVAGLWKSTDQEELNYVPPPPPSIDQGPSTLAPADDNSYVPGCWVYRQTRFLWRPGFWIAHKPGWVWSPSHYVWSPVGCVYVDGYWDHPLEERGLLFAPVRIEPRFLTRENWSYTPRYVVRSDFLISALFARRATNSYYFGDYFGPRYEKRGYVSWIDYRVNRYRNSYDPNFNYYRQQFAGERGWETNLRALYVGRRRGEIERPPQTLTQQTQVVNNFTVNKTTNVSVNKTINITNLQNVSVLAPLTQVNNIRATGMSSLAGRNVNVRNVKAHVVKLQAVPQQQRVALRKEVQQVRKVAVERRQVEAKMLSQGNHPIKLTDRPRAVKYNLPTRVAPKTNGKPTPTRKGPPPPPPAAPKQVTKPIPQYERPKQVRPPRNTGKNPVTTPKREVIPPKKEVIPPKREVIPPKKEVIPPKRNVIPPKKEVIPPKREVIPPKKEVIPPKRNVIPPKREVVPPKKVTLPPVRVVPPPKREVVPPKTVTPPPKKVVPPPPKKDRKP